MPEIILIPPHDIRPPITSLRPVLTEGLEFLQLIDSIQKYGLLNSIMIRRTSQGCELVDGAWRVAASKVAELLVIPAIVIDIPDNLVHTLQIITNSSGKKTDRVEFAKHIERIRRVGDTEMSINDLAVLINKSPTWISQTLELLELDPEIQIAVNRGEIPLASARLLARAPTRAQKGLASLASIKTTRDFKGLFARYIQKYTEVVKDKNATNLIDIHNGVLEGDLVPYQRPLTDVLEEIEQHVQGGLVVFAGDVKTPLDGFYAGLKWTLHLDKESVKRRIEKENQRLIDYENAKMIRNQRP